MAALARRLSSVVLTGLMVLAVMAPAASAASHEGEILTLLNAERAAAGLGPVSMHSDLTDDAAAWSQHLLAQGTLSHNPNLSSVTTGWDKLGENVGVGTSAASLHSAFMASSSHRGNILGDYQYVGIAVVEETSSKLWVTVVFMKPIGQEPEPEPLEDPVPYAEEQPATGPAPLAPVAATPASGSSSPAPKPVVGMVVAYAGTGVRPFAD